MFLPLTAAALCLLVAPAEPRPSALVLSVKGTVVVRPPQGASYPAEARGLVFAGDKLAVPADGEIALVFFGGGARERVKPGTEVTVDSTGCTPAEAVTRRQANGGPVAAALKDVPPVHGGGRAAVANFRSPGALPKTPPRVTPISGSTVPTDRPTLTWKPAADAPIYRANLRIGGSDRLIWKAETKQARLPFPEQEQPLKRGRNYHWQVSDADGRIVAEGRFTVALEGEAKTLTELGNLAAEADPADQLAAAMAFETLGADDEALAVYELLVKREPGDLALRKARARLYERAGLAPVPKSAPGDGTVP